LRFEFAGSANSVAGSRVARRVGAASVARGTRAATDAAIGTSSVPVISCKMIRGEPAAGHQARNPGSHEESEYARHDPFGAWGECRDHWPGRRDTCAGRAQKPGWHRDLHASGAAGAAPPAPLPLRFPLLVLQPPRLLPLLQLRLLGAARRDALPLSLRLSRPAVPLLSRLGVRPRLGWRTLVVTGV
jgi:hypothetical protein